MYYWDDNSNLQLIEKYYIHKHRAKSYLNITLFKIDYHFMLYIVYNIFTLSIKYRNNVDKVIKWLFPSWLYISCLSNNNLDITKKILTLG